jgi:hypothetical protein
MRGLTVTQVLPYQHPKEGAEDQEPHQDQAQPQQQEEQQDEQQDEQQEASGGEGTDHPDA